MSRDQDPLTPEERALADAMARAAGPRRGPPPQVDAAILASARASLARDAAPPARRRRRWPATLGVAASLVFAVGIAWQLRPAPDQELPAVTEGPPPTAPVAADRAAPAEARRYQSPAEDAPAPETAPPTGQSLPAPEPADAEPAASPTREAAPRLRELTLPQPEAARGAVAPPPPPAPPAPPAPAAETQAGTVEPAAGPAIRSDSTRPPMPAETAIGRSRVTQKAAARPARTLDRSTTVATPTLDAASRAATADDDGGIVFDRHALHDVPPATVDSPAIHRAWLDRIRELRDAGELEAARENLREYRRRYPDQPLPDDLDGLLDE